MFYSILRMLICYVETTSNRIYGLEDKNGQEIYEGYIIENGYGELLLVEYEEESARWVGSNNKGWVALDDLLEAKGEVIGNIFDNPELLGDK